MKPSKIILIAIYSVIIMFIASAGGIINPFLNLISLGLVYFLVIYFFIRNDKSKKNKLIKGIILIGAYFIAFIILHIIEADNILLLHTLPFVIIPVISGLIAYRVTTTCSTRRKLIISFSFLFGLMLFGLLVYPNWENWVMFPNAREKIKLPDIALATGDGDTISTNSFRGKTTIIDFWTTRCGICYKKFPDFETLHNFYKTDTNIVFYSIHIPTKYDSLENSNKLLDEFNYSFNKLYSLNPDDKISFNIPFFPVLVIVNKDLDIIYKGDLNTKWFDVVYNTKQILDREIKIN